MSFLIGSDFKRPDSEVVEAFTRVGTAALGHLTDFGFPRGLRPVAQCGPFAGPALTIKIPHVDSTAVHRAMSLVRPGDVVVIDQSGDDRRSSFGGTLAAIAADLGAVAAVCDGSTNDVEEIRELGFPVHSRGVTSLTTRVLSLEGRINVPVSIGGVVVMPGDIVFGDGDGIAVVPADEAAEIAGRLLRFEDETARLDLRGGVRAGTALAALTGADRGGLG
ncbi:RraA family protein [Streptomyces sp. NPDC056500]|uniref:RraA family protein n=1 Tax=Streptomyces sp. NPDC056500 TaxID=3345840 RepID=UPI0036B55D65